MKIISPIDFFVKIQNKFDKNDLLIAISVFVIGFINSFYFIIGDGVSPDALYIHNFHISGNWELSLGRFLIKYVDSMRFGLVNKLLIVLISLLCITLSIMLLKRIFNIKNKLSLFLLAFVISVAPQFAETYMFIYCADAYLLAFLFSVLSVYFLNKIEIKKMNYLFAIICIIITCGLYQAYFGVILGLIIALLVYKVLIDKVNFKELAIKLLKYILVTFIGILVYYFVLKMCLFIYKIELSTYKGANNLGLNIIFDLPTTLLNCYRDFYKFFFTNKIINDAYYHRKWIYFVLFIFTFLGLIMTLNSKNKKPSKFFSIFMLFLFYPICINIMNVIVPGTNINLVTGPGILVTILFPILIIDNEEKTNIINLIKWIIVCDCMTLAWTFVLENTFTYMVREQTYNNYKLVTTDLYNKVTSLGEYKDGTQWMFSDVIRYKPNNLYKTNGFISNDNVTWDNYDGLYLNKEFYEKYFGININIVDKTTYDKIKNTEEFKEMPIYPDSGSIKIIDGIAVIKISKDIY